MNKLAQLEKVILKKSYFIYNLNILPCIISAIIRILMWLQTLANNLILGSTVYQNLLNIDLYNHKVNILLQKHSKPPRAFLAALKLTKAFVINNLIELEKQFKWFLKYSNKRLFGVVGVASILFICVLMAENQSNLAFKGIKQSVVFEEERNIFFVLKSFLKALKKYLPAKKHYLISHSYQ